MHNQHNNIVLSGGDAFLLPVEERERVQNLLNILDQSSEPCIRKLHEFMNSIYDKSIIDAFTICEEKEPCGDDGAVTTFIAYLAKCPPLEDCLTVVDLHLCFGGLAIIFIKLSSAITDPDLKDEYFCVAQSLMS